MSNFECEIVCVREMGEGTNSKYILDTVTHLAPNNACIIHILSASANGEKATGMNKNTVHFTMYRLRAAHTTYNAKREEEFGAMTEFSILS